jgi:DNA polymerase-3 subunit gamma/tau
MIALARKYRPKRFADLIAQEHVAAALRGAVALGRVAHGYLFAGPRGVGKTTAARVLAMALNCPKRSAEGEPCGECESCARIWTGATSLDVVELDAASNRGVDDARDLRERAMYAASSEQRFKVYILDEAHMLTREAWNALLKVLEEPPPRVVFVFATTEPHKIAQTAAPILSRLQRFDFRRMGPQAIGARLREVLEAEGLASDDESIHLIARSAAGGMRDALSILDQVLSFGEGALTGARVRDVLGLIPDEVYAELLRVIAERDAKSAFPLMDRLMEVGSDLGEFLAGAGDVLRAMLQVQLGGAPEGLTDGVRVAIERHRARLPAPDLVRLLGLLAETDARLRTSGNVRLAVELLVLRWALMDRTVEIGAVLESLGRGPVSAASRGSDPAPMETPTGAEPPGAGVGGGAPESGPLDLERMRHAWPTVIETARRSSQMLAALLSSAEPAEVQGDTLLLRVRDQNPVAVEGLERQREAIQRLLGPLVAGQVRVAVARSVAEGGRAKPARMTEEGARSERLKALRAKDPALNSAVDALDLELLE